MPRSRPSTSLPALLATLPFLLATLPAQRGEAPTLEHYTVATGTLTSPKVRNGEAGYEVFLPKGHGDEANQAKVYPWILWLPGFGGAGEFGGRGGAKVLDRLRGAGEIPELAVVVYRAPGRNGRPGRSVYMNGEAAADTEDLLVGDLLTEVQTKYRLAAERKQRALMGISAGGFGALKIALRHPEVFGAVAVHSAAILPANPDDLGGMSEQVVQRFLRNGLDKALGNPIDKTKWAEQMPMAIVATKKPADLKGLQIYFDAGTEDGYEFCPPNEALSKAMAANGHKHLFRKIEGGGHAFGSESMQDNVAFSLRFVAATFAGKDAVTELSPQEPGKAADKQPADAGSGGGK